MTVGAQNVAVVSFMVTNRVCRRFGQVEWISGVHWYRECAVCVVTGTEKVLETSVYSPFNHLTRLLEWGYFIEERNTFFFNYIYIYIHKVEKYIGPIHVELKFDGYVWSNFKNETKTNKWKFAIDVPLFSCASVVWTAWQRVGTAVLLSVNMVC